ncbi:cobalt-precorrin-6A reductase [Microbaculum marinisediminis]|uniref:Cobalt-precorrin-6A reductase n=1 Tax=Microbaculum marinisediminis TaxID=2931392 RepID=A0AAW5QZQ1_9HYPH|nr:cobalt-precorrin-6A reductase [Microbaculum sp. A6E488]MCT8971893.1 cobalt-precorrin-6A reductase [Microbaculum sp. A6E488]
MTLKLLILGGTTEASALARAIKDDARVSAVLSLAGTTKAPARPPIPFRIGGFGGAQGLADYLIAERTDLLIDATHPFAAVMKGNAAEAARRAGVPLLAIRRPEWRAEPGDDWTVVADMKSAAAALGPARKRVLLTIGQKELAPFKAAPQHAYVVRSVDAPAADSLPPDAQVITARGPFAEADERRLLAEHGIEALVTKNSGGTATRAKLVAARSLGVPVIMVARPPAPDVEAVETVEAALAWLARFHETNSSTRRGV